MLVINRKYRGLLFIIFVLRGICATSFAQPRDDGFFKDGESVNFIGNSITHGGEFHSYIQLYYATRFPSQRITFYNSGIWGDSANQILKRMDKDILVNKSDYAVVMAGMNDVNRVLYAEKRKQEADIEKLKLQALADYSKNLEKLIIRLEQENMKIIIQKPSIYDETAKLKMENLVSVNAALAKCCGIIDELAAKYNLKVVDFYTVMNAVNAALQKQNDSATIVSYDRIHPSTPGSFLMAAQFLKETNSPPIVSSVSIKKAKLLQSTNCKVGNLFHHKDSISFTVIQ
jgi:lysophospholipase L1-like esterase